MLSQIDQHELRLNRSRNAAWVPAAGGGRLAGLPMTMTNGGATELDAGAEIDVENGRPTERRKWKKAERRWPTSVGKTAPRSSRLRRSPLGAVWATAMDEWEAVEDGAVRRKRRKRRWLTTNHEEAL